MKFHFILPWAMLSFLVFLEQPLIKPQTQGELNFVEDKMGADERDVIQVKRADYILSLLFLIEGTEEYLSDLKGSIKDANGNIFQDAVSDGLMLFSEFKPRRDVTSVDREGQWIDKTVRLGGKTAASPPFTWSRRAEHAALDLSGR